MAADACTHTRSCVRACVCVSVVRHSRFDSHYCVFAVQQEAVSRLRAEYQTVYEIITDAVRDSNAASASIVSSSTSSTTTSNSSTVSAITQADGFVSGAATASGGIESAGTIVTGSTSSSSQEIMTKLGVLETMRANQVIHLGILDLAHNLIYRPCNLCRHLVTLFSPLCINICFALPRHMRISVNETALSFWFSH